MSPNDTFAELTTRLAEIHDLDKAVSLLLWDQDVMMPRGGAAARAEQVATLRRIAHEKLVAPDIGRLLDGLSSYAAGLPDDSDEASLIRVTRRDYEKARRVPAELRAAISRTGSLARAAWVEARAASDFAMFLPFLQKTIDLKRRYIGCFEAADEPYDTLLDDYEEGMTAADVRAVFEPFKQQIVPLIASIAARADRVSDACLHGVFPVDRQREFCLSVVRRFGFTEDHWRLDPTIHPFETSLSVGDIRITTRYSPDFVSPALFGIMHECGHGLYEQGISPSLERTPLCRGTSLGLHESQSRLWENLVGRSRAAWSCFYPELQRAFPEQLRDVELETFYRAINRVEPSLIRVEADELTYGLHVILRFELEQEMIAGSVRLADLPDAWNARMKAYLGVDVPDAARGALQDVHWALGFVGYFPTYTIGSIMSAQIWQRALVDLPDLPEQFTRGEFLPLRDWLREHLHRHGRKFTPRETLEKAAGTRTIDVAPYIAYLTSKYHDIYGIGSSSPDA